MNLAGCTIGRWILCRLWKSLDGRWAKDRKGLTFYMFRKIVFQNLILNTGLLTSRFVWVTFLFLQFVKVSEQHRFNMGKVHGSLARAGKVKGQTPKVEKQEEKKKMPRGRAKKRLQYNRRYVNVVTGMGGKRVGPNSNADKMK